MTTNEYIREMKEAAARNARHAERSIRQWDGLAYFGLGSSLLMSGFSIYCTRTHEFGAAYFDLLFAIVMLWNGRSAVWHGKHYHDRFMELRQEALDYANQYTQQ